MVVLCPAVIGAEDAPGFAALADLGLNGGGFFDPPGFTVTILLGKGDGTFQDPQSYDAGFDPIGKIVRVGKHRYTVVGAFDKRASMGGFGNNADDFVTIPYTTYQRVYGLKAVRALRKEQAAHRVGFGAPLPLDRHDDPVASG